MTALALAVGAILFLDPSPFDAMRFGFAVVDPCQSAARDNWRRANNRLRAHEDERDWFKWYAREDAWDEERRHRRWVERSWDALDDLANAQAPCEQRWHAALRLRRLIGPGNYYLGNMPEWHGE